MRGLRQRRRGHELLIKCVEDAPFVKTQRMGAGANLRAVVEPAVRRQPRVLEGRQSIDRDLGFVSQLFEGQAPAFARVPEQIGHGHKDAQYSIRIHRQDRRPTDQGRNSSTPVTAGPRQTFDRDRAKLGLFGRLPWDRTLGSMYFTTSASLRARHVGSAVCS